MKKGFTLAELLGVIVIIGILLILIVPTIINRINSSREEAENAGNNIIYDAADQYIREHPDDYPPGKSGRYCIEIKKLIEDGKLIQPVINAATGEDISDKSVMVTIYSAGTKDYEIKNGNDCQTLESLPMIDFKVDPRGSSWVKQRKVTIIYPKIDGDFLASHRIDQGSWIRDTSADKGGNIELIFTKIGQLEARLKGTKIITSKINVVNVDSEVPVITKINMGTWSDDKNNLQITAKDDISGLNGMYISTTNSKPNENDKGWITISSKTKETKVFSKALEPGTYYIWVKDKAGNISEGKVGKVEETFCPGNICYVSSNGNDNNYGTRKKPLATLQKAFDIVETGGQVVMLSNLKCPASTLFVPANKSITLKSDADNKFILYRHDTYQSFMIHLNQTSASLTIKNIIIDGNYKNVQEPMIVTDGKLVIEDSILRNARNLNDIWGIGATMNAGETGEAILKNVEIYNNQTNAGGSAINSGGHITLYNVSIHDNEAWDGTIWNYGTIEMHSGRIYNNRAHYDAGVRNYNKFYMYGGEIDHNTSVDTNQSGGLKDGCYYFNWGFYTQGVSQVCNGCIHDNYPRDYHKEFNICDNA